MMKKMAAGMALAALLILAGCTQQAAGTVGKQQDTKPQVPAGNQPQTTVAATGEAVPQTYGFLYETVMLIPGKVFSPEDMPEADSVFEAPSCAFTGMEVTYSYPGFELLTKKDGKEEILCGVYLLDVLALTPEGLTLGDSTQDVLDTYGQPGEQAEGKLSYQSGEVELQFLIQNGQITGIAYLWSGMLGE